MDNLPESSHDIPIGSIIVYICDDEIFSGVKYRDATPRAKNIVPVEILNTHRGVKTQAFRRVDLRQEPHTRRVVAVLPPAAGDYKHEHVTNTRATKPWQRNICGCVDNESD